MAELIEYLKAAREGNVSDLYIVAGCPVSAKSRGAFRPLNSEKLLPPKTEELITGLYEMADRSMASYRKGCRDSFTFSVPGLARFRVNAYRQRGSMAAVIRVVTFEIPSWEKLHIPPTVMDLAGLKRGLVLITGGAESGRSTTQACLIDRINRTRSCHVVTLEAPIEFLYRDEKCIISQQEIGEDIEDMSTGLRYCMRQAPDIIMLGDLLDLELLRSAMAAAEGGRLVIASLPTKGVLRSLDRLLELFPAGQQDYARVQLSHVLRAVISQQLLPGKDGGMVPAFEELIFDRTVCDLFRAGREKELFAAAGEDGGAVAMDRAIAALCRQGLIDPEVAVSFADDPDQMGRLWD